MRNIFTFTYSSPERGGLPRDADHSDTPNVYDLSRNWKQDPWFFLQYKTVRLQWLVKIDASPNRVFRRFNSQLFDQFCGLAVDYI